MGWSRAGRMAAGAATAAVMWSGVVGVAHAHPGHDSQLAVAAEGTLAQSGQSSSSNASSSKSNLRNEVTITTKDGFREITSNGIPNHAAGAFPNRNNPNAIAPQQYRFRMPLEPKVNEQPTPMRGLLFGVALNGVVFDPGTAEFWNNDRRAGWNYEAQGGAMNLGLDQNLAHVQPSGAYHYHGIATGLIEQLAKGKGAGASRERGAASREQGDASHGAAPVAKAGEKRTAKSMLLIGYAADGFPIYGPEAHADANDPSSALKKMKPSYRLKAGTRPGGNEGPGGKYDGAFTADFEYVKGAGDLDECNGRSGITPEYPNGTYYYVLTDTFPFIPRVFRGTPDESFRKTEGPGGPGGRGPGGAGGPGGRRPPPPREGQPGDRPPRP